MRCFKIGGKRKEEPRSPVGKLYRPFVKRKVRSPNQMLSHGCALLNQYISARARLKLGRSPRYLCSVPPGRAQREPQGYAGLTRLRRSPRFAWRAPRRAAASRQQGLTTLGKPGAYARCARGSKAGKSTSTLQLQYTLHRRVDIF